MLCCRVGVSNNERLKANKVALQSKRSSSVNLCLYVCACVCECECLFGCLLWCYPSRSAMSDNLLAKPSLALLPVSQDSLKRLVVVAVSRHHIESRRQGPFELASKVGRNCIQDGCLYRAIHRNNYLVCANEFNATLLIIVKQPALY